MHAKYLQDSTKQVKATDPINKRSGAPPLLVLLQQGAPQLNPLQSRGPLLLPLWGPPYSKKRVLRGPPLKASLNNSIRQL